MKIQIIPIALMCAVSAVKIQDPCYHKTQIAAKNFDKHCDYKLSLSEVHNRKALYEKMKQKRLTKAWISRHRQVILLPNNDLVVKKFSKVSSSKLPYICGSAPYDFNDESDEELKHDESKKEDGSFVETKNDNEIVESESDETYELDSSEESSQSEDIVFTSEGIKKKSNKHKKTKSRHHRRHNKKHSSSSEDSSLTYEDSYNQNRRFKKTGYYLPTQKYTSSSRKEGKYLSAKEFRELEHDLLKKGSVKGNKKSDAPAVVEIDPKTLNKILKKH